MTVVTSPQGRQRIVVHETKVIWILINYQFFDILVYCIKRPSAVNGSFSHAQSHTCVFMMMMMIMMMMIYTPIKVGMHK